MLEKLGLSLLTYVALRKESVDRNTPAGRPVGPPQGVALRKESVDRNNGVHYDNYNLHWSLSARRAWIEMFLSMGLDGRFKRRSPQGERG